MCLIAFNWIDHPDYKLILVANRDEFFDRPTTSLQLWESGFYAGKDLRAGGTWLGIHPNGRFAALTNYRDLNAIRKDAKSRGDLVRNYLEGSMDPVAYLQEIEKEKGLYDGFNLLVGTAESLYYFSNMKEGIEKLEPGLYGLSNALLETPWAKLQLAKTNLQTNLVQENLNAEILIQGQQSRETEAVGKLPSTGATPEQEKLLSAQFINVGNYYGTINTTVVLWKHTGEVEITERRFDQVKELSNDTKLKFKMQSLQEQDKL